MRCVDISDVGEAVYNKTEFETETEDKAALTGPRPSHCNAAENQAETRQSENHVNVLS